MPEGNGSENGEAIGAVTVDVMNADVLESFARVLGDAMKESGDRQAAAIEKLTGAVEELASGQGQILERVDGIVGSLRDQTKTIARSNFNARKRGEEMIEAARKVSGSAPDPSR